MRVRDSAATMTTFATITTSQIATLRAEAATAGDIKMVAICDRALAESTRAIRECVRVISDAETMVRP